MIAGPRKPLTRDNVARHVQVYSELARAQKLYLAAADECDKACLHFHLVVGTDSTLRCDECKRCVEFEL
jgi:hypothetical protein